MEERIKKFGTAYDCGVTCLPAKSKQSDNVGKELKRLYESGKYKFGIVYFSCSIWTPNFIRNLLETNAPDLQYAACSTSGELTPKGMAEGELLIILFPRDTFEFNAFHIEQTEDSDIQVLVKFISEQKESFFGNSNHENIWPVAIYLIDGLSNNEEAIAAAMHWALDDIPLLGGSAGDNMEFENTTLLLNGEIVKSPAIFLFIKSRIPLEVFKTENFVPTKKKLVVTHSQPNSRTVYELNGSSASRTYSELIHHDPMNLAPDSFASHPLVVKVGGEYYCRSIQKVNNDGSMTFFCAIDDGIVLTMAEPRGMVESTKRKLKEIDEKLGGIDFILGFDCVLRKIDASNRQVSHAISDVYRDFNLIGFNTYGEQYRSMHLNQTLTGLAFGSASRG